MLMNDISSIGTLIAAIISASAFFWALFQWIDQRRHERLVRFRDNIVSMRTASATFSEEFSDLSAIDIGNIAADWVMSKTPSRSASEVLNLLKNGDSTQILIGCYTHGYFHSEIQSKRSDLIRDLRSVGNLKNEEFPIMSHFFSICAKYYSQFSSPYTVTTQIHQLIQAKKLPNIIIDSIDEGVESELVYSILADNIAQISAIPTARAHFPAAVLAHIIEIVSGNYLSRSDKQLMEASAHEIAARKKFNSGDFNKYSVEIIAILDAMEPVFSRAEFHELIRLRTQFHDHYEKSE